MNLETEAYSGELQELRSKVALYSKIFTHAFAADKVGDVYFICGEGGTKDDNNLPERIHICPAFGCDWFQVYERTDKTFGPEW
jgi:hypothetical protein